MISLQCRRLALHGFSHVPSQPQLCRSSRVMVSPSHDCISMSYIRYGTTPPIITSPVLIMHSLFETKAHWSGIAALLVKHLEPRRSVITVDLRNHGESEYVDEYSYEEMVADLDKLIVDLDLAKVVMFGFGLGGMAAMLYSIQHPCRVERLIVQDTCPFSFVDVEDLTQTIQAMRACRIPQAVPFEEAAKMAEQCLTKDISNEMRRRLILRNLGTESNGRYIWKMNLRDIESNLHKVVNFPMVRAKFRGPTLFLGSTDYYLTRKSPLDRLAAVAPFFPNAKVIVFPNCGHYIHLEKTNHFLSVIKKFLAE